SLTARGLSGVKYIVSDDHEGLKSALESVFPNVIWNRCHTHLARNAQPCVSRKINKADVASDIRDILQAADQETAQFLLNRFIETWQKTEPKLVEWAELNIPEGFNVFNLPKAIQKRLRTTNLIERMNQELKRRSRVVRIFPNEASCLRLLSAVALEIHEDWLTERRCFSDDYLIISETIGNRNYRKKVA
ncbi:MAG: IS256 family transposase, partial [bacterium]|nr:IS256 family transposase [bacterium]